MIVSLAVNLQFNHGKIRLMESFFDLFHEIFVVSILYSKGINIAEYFKLWVLFAFAQFIDRIMFDFREGMLVNLAGLVIIAIVLK